MQKSNEEMKKNNINVCLLSNLFFNLFYHTMRLLRYHPKFVHCTHIIYRAVRFKYPPLVNPPLLLVKGQFPNVDFWIF